MKQQENAGSSPRQARPFPTRSHFASVGSVLRDKAQTGRKTPADVQLQPVSLILLDRPSSKKAARASVSSLHRKSKRPTTCKTPKPVHPRALCHSAEREKRANIEVGLDRAVLELSEIKAEYHIEKTELDRQMIALDKKTVIAGKKDLEELPLNRDCPPSIREKKLNEKLEFAETTMRLLFEKNQQLEEQIKRSPLPHEDCHSREADLQRQVTELSSEMQLLEGQLATVWEARMQQFRDPASDYQQTRIRHSLQDSKRYLGYYWTLRQKVQSLVPEASNLAQFLAFEREIREEERREYEQRLSQWEQLNCDLYVKNRLLKRQLP